MSHLNALHWNYLVFNETQQLPWKSWAIKCGGNGEELGCGWDSSAFMLAHEIWGDEFLDVARESRDGMLGRVQIGKWMMIG